MMLHNERRHVLSLKEQQILCPLIFPVGGGSIFKELLQINKKNKWKGFVVVLVSKWSPTLFDPWTV